MNLSHDLRVARGGAGGHSVSKTLESTEENRVVAGRYMYLWCGRIPAIFWIVGP